MATKFETPRSTWLKWISDILAVVVSKFSSYGFTVGTYNGHEPTKDRAADFMIPTYKSNDGRRKGKELAEYLWDHAEEFNIWYVIYWDKIISRTPGRGYWRDYTPLPGRNDDSGRHHNHVHVSFYSKAVVIVKWLTMYSTTAVKGYKVKNGKATITKRRPAGYKLVGRIGKRSDGEYLVTRFGTWYPMDSLSEHVSADEVKTSH